MTPVTRLDPCTARDSRLRIRADSSKHHNSELHAIERHLAKTLSHLNHQVSLKESRCCFSARSQTILTDSALSMPRLVRRRPLGQRIKAYLNPLDLLLWLSEELDSSDWDQWQKEWATPMGICLNLVFLIARANSGPSTRPGDDVFGDDEGYRSWWGWFVRASSFQVDLRTMYN